MTQKAARCNQYAFTISYFKLLVLQLSKADGRCLGFRDKEVQGTCLGMCDID